MSKHYNVKCDHKGGLGYWCETCCPMHPGDMARCHFFGGGEPFIAEVANVNNGLPLFRVTDPRKSYMTLGEFLGHKDCIVEVLCLISREHTRGTTSSRALDSALRANLEKRTRL